VFILDVCLPKLPIKESAHVDSPHYPHSLRPEMAERIVFNTTFRRPFPRRARSWKTAPATVADDALKEKEREAFALMQSSDAKFLEPSPQENEAATATQNREAGCDAAFGPCRAAVLAVLLTPSGDDVRNP
jgi:hypothetical protein